MVAILERTDEIPAFADADSQPSLHHMAANAGHQQLPLVVALGHYQATIAAPFSAPGHKRGVGASTELQSLLGDDALAADVWMGFSAHDPAQRAAEDLAAAAWSADRSFFLVNGSSSGSHAFLLGTLGPGDEVVVARDVHQSVVAGFLLTGARPVWITPRLHPELDLSLGVDPGDVAAALDSHPAAKLVVLTSPTYYGIVSDVAGIVAVAHARGVPVYIDEAWGAHLPFHPALPPSAMASGADGAVTSAHKLLATPRQGALLNVRQGLVEVERVASTVRLTQTSSPSLPILAGLDTCRQQMVLAGEGLLERVIGLAFAARRRLGALTGISVLGVNELSDFTFDPTRLVIDVQGLGMTGFAAERVLRQRFGIAPAMSERTGIVCAITIGDTPQSVDRLVEAFATLGAEQRTGEPGQKSHGAWGYRALLTPGRLVLSPREAFFARSRTVRLADAIGHVAAELVTPYPPGIPAVVPGERVTAETVAYLREGVVNGMHLRGATHPELETMRIVTEESA
jgi:arginine/lysine/ornithine decarboxylase